MSETQTIVAAAQLCARDEDIAYNLREHERLIRLAAAHGVRLLIFPEMSVTGYVLEAADRLAFTPQDARLDGLRQLSALHEMIIVAGAPVRLGGILHIGSLIIFPNGTEALYTKHYLYGNEADYYTPNRDFTPMILLGNDKISPAICFDIENPPHLAQAKAAGATIYAPGIFYSENAMEDAHKLLGAYAEEHVLCVLMSNYCGYLCRTVAGGGSAFWNSNGDKLAVLNKFETGLVIGVREDGFWTGKTVIA